MADQSPHANDLVENDAQDATLVVNSLFDLTDNTVPLSTGKKVEIREARVASLPIIMDFFSAVIDGLDKDKLAQLVTTLAEYQQKALLAGADPKDLSIDIDGLPANVDQPDAAGLLGKFLENASLAAALAAVVSRQLPKVVAEFTNITSAEYAHLGLDDGARVAGAVFIRNYSFFTQKVPPIFAAFTRSWALQRNLLAPARK